MHIPDGLLSPATYAAGFAVALPFWVYGVRQVGKRLEDTLIPRLGVLTALIFVLNMVLIPLPGGTSAHFLGVGLLALVFGIWLAFLSYSIVLSLQALLLGVGGVTALGVSALCIGLLGPVVAIAGERLLRRWSPFVAASVGVWLSVVVSATALALILGLQPIIAAENGEPLFFPFGPEVTLPAVVGPHLLLGAAEGVLSALAIRRLRRWA